VLKVTLPSTILRVMLLIYNIDIQTIDVYD